MPVIKLDVDAFNNAAAEQGWTDTELASKMGISTTQLWRVRLADTDPRHNDPGPDFVAGALRAFPHKKFEDLFFLAEPLRLRKTDSKAATVSEGR